MCFFKLSTLSENKFDMSIKKMLKTFIKETHIKDLLKAFSEMCANKLTSLSFDSWIFVHEYLNTARSKNNEFNIK
jgi:hypothetical protein